MKRRVSLLFCIPLLYLSGCAAQQIHPGSPNQFDSTTYDSLIATHSVIETTKTDLANGAFPATITANVKTAVNDLIIAYNVTDTAYKAYHTAALAGNATADQQNAVTAGLAKIGAATTALTSAKAGK